jgi:hypothetical protein
MLLGEAIAQDLGLINCDHFTWYSEAGGKCSWPG